jgi:hypothetical protein
MVRRLKGQQAKGCFPETRVAQRNRNGASMIGSDSLLANCWFD